MKVLFPVQEDNGLESAVFNHFGSAPIFVMVDTENDASETFINRDLNHIHGQCQPLQAIGNAPVDAVVLAGAGKGALKKLQAAGIEIFRAVDGSIADNIGLIKSGKLPKFRLQDACAGHSRGAGQNHPCAHETIQ
jgi:predicted Fe-Mo cluster-binding NifX family protein